MSDEALVEYDGDAPTEQEVEVNPTQAFVDDLLAKNFAGAQTTFNDMLGAKLNDALDAEKVALAQQVYNGEDALEDDEDQLELALDQDDEEYEDDLEDGAEEYTSETDEEEVED